MAKPAAALHAPRDLAVATVLALLSGLACYFIFDVGEKGEKAGEVIDQLGQLAGLGFQAAIGSVVDVWQVSPLEAIGNEVIPAVAGL